MKRFLISLIACVCVSIGVWAAVPDGATAFGTNGSYWKVENGIATIYMAKTGDIGSSLYSNYSYPSDVANATKVVITTASDQPFSQADADSFWAFQKAECIDLSGADISSLKENGWIQAPASLPVFLFSSKADGDAVWAKGSSYWGQRWSGYGTNDGSTLNLYVTANTTQNDNGSSNMLSASVVGDASNIILQSSNSNSTLSLNNTLKNSINTARNNDESNRISSLTIVDGVLPQYSSWSFSNTWIHSLDLTDFNANNNEITFNSGGETATTHIESVNLTGAKNLSVLNLSNQTELTNVGLGGVTSLTTLNLTGVNLEGLTITVDSEEVIGEIIPETDSEGNTIDYASHIQTGPSGMADSDGCYISIDETKKTATVHAPTAGHFAALFNKHINYNSDYDGYTFKFDSESNVNEDDLKVLAGGAAFYNSNKYYVDLFDLPATTELCGAGAGIITNVIKWMRNTNVASDQVKTRQFKGLILPKDHTQYGSGTSLIQGEIGNTAGQVATCSEFIAYYKSKEENGEDSKKKLTVSHVYDATNTNSTQYAKNLAKMISLLSAHNDVENNTDIYQISTNSAAEIELSGVPTTKARVETYNNEMVTGTTRANITAYPVNAGDFAVVESATGIQKTTTEKLTIVGEMSEADFTAISSFKTANGPRVLDLSKVTTEITEALLKKIINDKIEYIVLPANVDKYKDLVLSNSAYANLSNLHAVILETDNEDENGTKTYSGNEVVANLFVEGSFYEARCHALGIDADNNGFYWLPNQITGVARVTLGGYLNASDIAANVTGEPYIFSSDGHFYESGTEGKSNDGLKALNYDQGNVAYMDLTKAVFRQQSDMHFVAAGLSALTELKLPTSSEMTTIPKDCFKNVNKILKKICIPYNFKIIEEYAFYDNGLEEISTTDASGNEITNGHGTMTIGAQVEQIKTGAFTPDYTYFTDVYVMAEKAPACEKDAFSRAAYVLENTFQGVQSHPYARDKYVVDNKGSMTLLHFPATVSSTEAANYTDMTRSYSLIDETGAVDGNGQPIKWPNQTEYLRSYNQAITGVTWAAWNEKRGDMNDVVYGEYGVDNSDLNIDGTTATYNKDKYMGWHEFALAATWQYIPTIDSEEVTYEQMDWYTFCLPYDMTKEEVINYLGVPASTENKTNKAVYKDGTSVDNVTEAILPDIRTLSGVTRNGDNYHITIHISANIAGKHVTIPENEVLRDFATTDASDEVYLKGGFPYFIRPFIPTDLKANLANSTLGGFVLMRHTFDVSTVGGHTSSVTEQGSGKTVNLRAPLELKVQAFAGAEDTKYYLNSDDTKDENEAIDGKEFIYTFVGQYWQQPLPLNCYYLGANNKFSRAATPAAGSTEFSKWTWKPYVAVITPKTSSATTKVVEPIYSESLGYMNTFSMTFSANDDKFDNTSWSRSVEFRFDDGIEELGIDNAEATGIKKLDGVEIHSAMDKVYNLKGQFVGNMVSGLPKGMYIVNGKKIVVK